MVRSPTRNTSVPDLFLILNSYHVSPVNITDWISDHFIVDVQASFQVQCLDRARKRIYSLANKRSEGINKALEYFLSDY